MVDSCCWGLQKMFKKMCLCPIILSSCTNENRTEPKRNEPSRNSPVIQPQQHLGVEACDTTELLQNIRSHSSLFSALIVVGVVVGTRTLRKGNRTGHNVITYHELQKKEVKCQKMTS